MNVKGWRYKLVPTKFLNVRFGIRFALSALFLWIMVFSPATATAFAIITGFTEEQSKGLEELFGGIATKHKDLVKTEMEALVNTKGLYTEAQFAAKLETLGVKDKTITDMLASVQKHGEDIQKLFAPKADEVDPSKSLDKMFKDKEKEIKSLSQGLKTQGFQMTLSNEQVKTLVQRSAVSASTMAMRLTEVGQLPYASSIFSSLFRHVTVSPDSNGVVRYMEQQAITRNAASVAEAGTKPESVMTWIERSATIEKIADSIPVTREAWNDVGFIRGELQTLLGINLELKEDLLLYSGDGISPNLKGIKTYSTAYDIANVNAAFYQKVTDANIYDLGVVLRIAIMNGILGTTGKQSKYAPNIAVMNPVDIGRMKLAKAADGHYILPPFIAANGMVVDGVVIKESATVTPNTMIIGDFRYGTVYDLEGVTVDMGYVNDQFIKNQTTLLAEKREMLLVKNVDVDAFLKVDDIDAAVASISI